MNLLVLLDENNGKEILEFPVPVYDTAMIDQYDNQLYSIPVSSINSLGDEVIDNILYRRGPYIGCITDGRLRPKYRHKFYYSGIRVQKLKPHMVPIQFEKEAVSQLSHPKDD